MSQSPRGLPRPNENNVPLVTVLVIVIVLVPGLTPEQRLLLMSGIGTVFIWARRRL